MLNPIKDQESETKPRPVLTLAIISYNQEKFIEEAISGALSQTYQPLQIIMSDDCSSDRTFEIMEKRAKEYDGPHEIVLNRNSKNVGLGEHVNQVFEKAAGDLVMLAAGDDVSLPERASESYRLWKKSKRPLAVFVGTRKISEEGEKLEDFELKKAALKNLEKNNYHSRIRDCALFKYRFLLPAGCAAAYDRSLFDELGRISPRIRNEDEAFLFRAILKGTIACSDSVQVLWRQHSQNLSNRRGELIDESRKDPDQEESFVAQNKKNYIPLFQGYITDFIKVQSGSREDIETLGFLYQRVQELAVKAYWWDLPTAERVKLSLREFPHLGKVVRGLLRCLPRASYVRIKRRLRK